MFNQRPSSSWSNFSTFLDEVNNMRQQQQGQPGQMQTWEDQFKLGNTNLPAPSEPYQFEQQGPNNQNAPGPMGGFPQFGGPEQDGQLQQQVLNGARNPAQQIFNEVGQGSRYDHYRQEQRDRSFNQFKSYGTQQHEFG
jgi:hypothetical protein